LNPLGADIVRVQPINHIKIISKYNGAQQDPQIIAL